MPRPILTACCWFLGLLSAACGDASASIERTVFLFNLEPERVTGGGVEQVDLTRQGSPAFRMGEAMIGFEARRGLQQARGSELVFEGVLAPAATLRFEVGFGRISGAAAGEPENTPFELEVLARSSTGQEARLWKATLTPPADEAQRAWQAVECALPFEPGALVFRTAGKAQPRPSNSAPCWANPRVSYTAAVPLQEEPPRDVVLFLVDTLRADHIGPLGHAGGTTPTLDALARESLVFTQASSASSWTKASVASLMTSLLPSRHGAEGYPDRLRESEVTLARVFAQAGYRTCAVGYNTWVFNPKFNLSSGFEDVIEVFDTSREGGARADAVVAEALDWILRAPEKPFFLYVHTIDPHEPYVPDAEYRARLVAPYTGDLTGRLEGPGRHTPRKKKDVSAADLTFLRQLYDAEIAFNDHMLGLLEARLRELGLWHESTLLFTSDHGEEFLDHGSWSHGGSLYQEQLHVPLLLKPPLSAGLAPERRERPVSLLDVAPTLCELARVPMTGAHFTGHSLLAASAPSGPILAELNKEGQQQVSVRDGDLKYIRVLAPVPREELYDLRSDPLEHQNLLKQTAPERLELLRDFVQAHLESAPRQGLYLEVVGDGGAAEVRITVRSPEAALGNDLLDCERNGDDLEARKGDPGTRIQAQLTLGEKDRRDALVLAPSAGTRLELELRLGGKLIDPARILLGPAATPADSAQLTLTAEDEALLVPRRPAWDDRPGTWVRIWQIRAEDSVELDEAALESLRALGYVK